MKKLFVSTSVLAVLAVSLYATMGFYKGEQISGMNKICFYDVLGSTHTLNVKSYELCPLNYDF